VSEGMRSGAGCCSGRGCAGGGKHSGADAYTAGLPGEAGLVLPRLGSELARRAEAGCFVTQLTGPILGKVTVPMTVDST